MPPAPDPNAARSMPEQRVVLAYPRPPIARGLLDRLARFLDLETYGDSLLTRGARSGLRTQASLLTIVFLFDTAVWSVMFNMLFGMGYLRLGWHTAFALLAGLGVAWVMFLWERNIATLDIDKGIGTRTWAGIGARVAIVSVAALATALPLELLLFKDEIYQRAYEESVRHEFVVKVREHKELDEVLRKLEEEKGTLSQQGPSARDLDPQRQARLAELRQQEKLLRFRSAANVEAMQKAQNDEERANLESKGKAINAELRLTQESISTVADDLRRDQTSVHAAKVGVIQADIDCKRERQAKLTDWLGAIRKNDYARRPELKRSVRLASCAAPTTQEPTPAPPATPTSSAAPDDAGDATLSPNAAVAGDALVEDPNRIDFYLGVPTLRIFDQVRILWALQKGRPPEWREADDELIKELQQRYNLRDKASPATAIYTTFALMALLVGMAIPLMSLMFKLVGNQEIKNYYSFAAQAWAGNAEALHVLASQDYPGGAAAVRA